MTTWSAEERRRFLESIPDDRLYAAFLLAATTGMRRGEVLGLRWRDVDLAAARVSIRQTLVTIGYAGACLFAGQVAGTDQAVLVGAEVKFTTGFTGAKQ